jgi:hypothetical protein
MPFEILNRAFVFLRRSLAVERAEIFSLARSRIFLARIQPILGGLQFPNHAASNISQVKETPRVEIVGQPLRLPIKITGAGPGLQRLGRTMHNPQCE